MKFPHNMKTRRVKVHGSVKVVAGMRHWLSLGVFVTLPNMSGEWRILVVIGPVAAELERGLWPMY